MKGCKVYSRSVIKLEMKHCCQTSTTAMYFLWVQKPNIQACVVGKHKSELQTPNRHISNTISGKAESEMERKVGSIWCLTLLVPGLLAGLCSGGSPTVVIDVYANYSVLTSGDSVPLGNQLILVCQVVGLPYGIPLSYSWICPYGPCEVKGYYGRKVYNEHTLALNTTSISDGGTYTCQVTATAGQKASGTFIVRVTGGSVVHSYGRVIPHEFPITDLQQISGPDGIGRINCTVSSGTARFVVNGGQLETGGVSETRNGATSSLVVNPTDVGSFQNRALYCTNLQTNHFYLLISSASPLSVPSLTINTATNTGVEYQVEKSDTATTHAITGYEVFRLGVPMIGEYTNAGTRRRVTISPVVPGAQYRITAWALDSGTKRSATPAVKSVTTGEARPSPLRHLTVSRAFEDGIELNWLPPSEPNGEVLHCVIYYTPEGGTEQSIDTGSNLTHYNLTGLRRNRVYTNFGVQAFTSAGWSDRSSIITQYNHNPPVPSTPPLTTASTVPSSNPLLPAVASLTVVVLLLITCAAILVAALVVTANKLKKLRAERAHTEPLCYAQNKERIYDEVGEGADPTVGLWGHYQALELKTMEESQYETLDKKNTSAKA